MSNESSTVRSVHKSQELQKAEEETGVERGLLKRVRAVDCPDKATLAKPKRTAGREVDGGGGLLLIVCCVFC